MTETTETIVGVSAILTMTLFVFFVMAILILKRAEPLHGEGWRSNPNSPPKDGPPHISFGGERGEKNT